MNKLAIIGLITIMLGGCSAIPSFYDDNESRLAVDVRYQVQVLNCSENYREQAQSVIESISILELYSDSKGSSDVYEMIQPMQKTAEGLQNMTQNEMFCKLKKKELIKQSKLIADAIMRRY